MSAPQRIKATDPFVGAPARSSPVRLGRARRFNLYVIGIGVWLTGGVWLILHYFFARSGDFGMQTHPLEPWTLKLHGAFAFATIWLLGLLWGVHITTAWPLRRRRWSGGITTGVLLVLTLTGYLLYYVGSETARPIISVLHWTIGLAAPLAYFWHRFKFKARR